MTLRGRLARLEAAVVAAAPARPDLVVLYQAAPGGPRGWVRVNPWCLEWFGAPGEDPDAGRGGSKVVDLRDAGPDAVL